MFRDFILRITKIFKYLTFTFILICCFGIFNVKAETAMPLTQAYYGIDIAEYNSGTPNPRYLGSYVINGNNTQYSWLPSTGITSSIMFRIFLYGDFKKDNYYTFTFEYDMGDLLEVYLTPLNTKNNVSLFNGSDYVIQAENTSAIAENPRTQWGKIVVSFKATANTSSVRILLGDNSSWDTILLSNYSTQYEQGFRIKSVVGTYTEDLSNAYLGQITQQNQTIINQNQNIINNQTQTNDILTSDETPEPDGLFDDANDLIITDTPVSDLVLLPFTLIETYLQGFDGSISCSPINLGNFLGTDLTLPCINPGNLLGNTIWVVIDDFICLFLIYDIAMLMISTFEKWTSLYDTYYELYEAKHVGYKPRHGGD